MESGDEVQDAFIYISNLSTIARTDQSEGSHSVLKNITRRRFDDFQGTFLWGRVPVDQLVAAMSEFGDIPADREYFDLATSLTEHGKYVSADQQCFDLLSKTGGNPRACVCLIDRGDKNLGGTAYDFGGKLTHVVRNDVEVSSHCKAVLSVLLERLQSHGILSEVEIVCALVADPPNPIGRACFDHANTVEIAGALNEVDKHMSGVRLPTAVNLSLGTHVGPHNGLSPLEELVTQLGQTSSGRAFHVSAGNDGMRDVSAQVRLVSGVPEFMRVETGSSGCGELLVEFWWSDPTVRLECAVNVRDAAGTLMFGSSGIQMQQGATGKSLVRAANFNKSSTC